MMKEEQVFHQTIFRKFLTADQFCFVVVAVHVILVLTVTGLNPQFINNTVRKQTHSFDHADTQNVQNKNTLN